MEHIFTSAQTHDSSRLPTREKKTTPWLGWRRSKGSSDSGAGQSVAETPSSLVPPQSPHPKLLDSPWSPRPRAPPQAAFQFWEDVLSALDAVPEYKLRFALAEFAMEDHLVLVCDGARPKDEIYQIERSNLPVALRRSHASIDLIGEVCITRQATGEWNLAQFELSTEDPFYSKTRDMEAESLNIKLEGNSIRRVPSYESLYKE